jgi:outer membrane protein W
MKLFIKTALLVAVAAGCTLTANAQAYEQGSKQLNVGIGLGSTLTGSGLKSTIPPIGLSFEYGLKEKISVGGYLGYAGASQETFGWKWTYTYIVVGARGSYHFATTDKLDPYVGVLLGYNAASVKAEKPAGYTGPDLPSASAGGVIVGGHLGARYMFSDKIGAFGELGYGIAYLQLGLTAKF